MKGKIFLSGGGSEKDTYDFDKEFINSLKSRKILYIPIAMERDFLGYEGCYDWVVSSLTQFDDELVDITMCTDLKDGVFSNLNKFDAVYIGGGNTYRLLDKIYTAGIDKHLSRFLDEGGSYYGGSAGAIIMGKSINTVLEENDKNYKYQEGLKKVGCYSLIAHFDIKNDEKIQKINTFLVKYKTPVIAIPEGTGLVIKNGKMGIIGRLPACVFYPNGRKKELLTKSSFNFLKDEDQVEYKS